MYSHEVPPEEQADNWEWSIDLNLQPSFEVIISIILHLFDPQLSPGTHRSLPYPLQALVSCMFSSILPNSNIQSILRATSLGLGKFSVQDLNLPGCVTSILAET